MLRRNLLGRPELPVRWQRFPTTAKLRLAMRCGLGWHMNGADLDRFAGSPHVIRCSSDAVGLDHVLSTGYSSMETTLETCESMNFIVSVHGAQHDHDGYGSQWFDDSSEEQVLG